MSDEKKIAGNFYLLKNENNDLYVGASGGDGSYAILSSMQVVEVFVADADLYVKEVNNWNAVDTTYYSISMNYSHGNLMCDVNTYDSVKNIVASRHGIIISGWHVPK
ncbi:hypothetical protein [Chitinophaga varians]|uniref:hypothetical protein n=1 Tax=Chitinophaga varians TaxID=2202339 RepID=UPI00165F4563|nr:hypothetical protein [Chitinophaga varians]MBC9912357.1 hypothetical protein [Chitinophaga varians]